MNDPAISITFRYSKTDYVRAMRAHLASRLRPWLDICVISLVGIAGIYLWPSLSGKVFLGISATFVLVLLAIFFIMPPLAFRREPKFRDEYSLTFSPEGIHFQTVHIDSQLQWHIYSRALADSNSYVLYYGTQSFTVIPKRVFESIEQRGAFEKLLAKHVPKIINK